MVSVQSLALHGTLGCRAFAVNIHGVTQVSQVQPSLDPNHIFVNTPKAPSCLYFWLLRIGEVKPVAKASSAPASVQFRSRANFGLDTFKFVVRPIVKPDQIENISAGIVLCRRCGDRTMEQRRGTRQPRTTWYGNIPGFQKRTRAHS
jgi:hypothetical protein